MYTIPRNSGWLDLQLGSSDLPFQKGTGARLPWRCLAGAFEEALTVDGRWFELQKLALLGRDAGVKVYGCFLKWWYPTTMGFPTKNDHFGVFWGYHHLRKHSYLFWFSSSKFSFSSNYSHREWTSSLGRFPASRRLSLHCTVFSAWPSQQAHHPPATIVW